MGYRTIVVGTDGSVTATLARDAAMRLARRVRASLAVVCVHDAARLPRPVADRVLRYAAEEAERLRVRVDTELATGDPAEAIIGAAERRGADLIVVGNKGMGRATRFRLGSVPDRIAHFAPCDLLIVDTTREVVPGGPPRPGYRSILVGTDGSPTAAEAARAAFELAMMLGSDVTLVYVGDPIVGAIRLEEAAAARPDGVEVETRTLSGDPAEALLGAAEAEGVDLVVVGNKGMAGPRRFLGSVPNKVAHYAPTDVLIVKTMDRTVDDLEPGHGGVVESEGRKLAVYRDPTGRLYRLSPRCTHMGCTVDWNDAEKTWDCPCHGSRYAFDGRVIQGPAARSLEPAGEGPGGETPATGAAAEQPGRPREAPQGPAPAPTGMGRRGERFVVVGASLAGGTAVATLREEGFDGSLTMVGAEPAFPYERPPLSKSFLRGETLLEEALVRPPEFYRDNDVQTLFGSTVTSVDPTSRTLQVAGGEPIPYDRLLIATGARNRRFPIPGLGLDGVHDLRTVDDAAHIRAEMAPGRSVVVAGMGFIGSEVAASLRQRGLEVAVVDGNTVPLERVLGEDIGRALEGIHRDHGVRMNFRDRVEAFQGNGRVERVVTANGLRLECDFAIVGLGVEPVAELVIGAGVAVDNGILVDELCRTNVEGIYAAGDVANHLHPVFGRRIRIEHWQNAIRQGRAAALSMLDKGKPYAEIHWFWSDQYDHNLQYAGFHTEWDDLVIRGSVEDRSFVAFYMKEGRVQAAVSMDRGSEMQQSMALIRAGGAVDAKTLRDESRDLSALSS